MIYFLGVRDNNVVLFNPDCLEFKKIEIDSFFKLLSGLSYSGLLSFINNTDEKKRVSVLNKILLKNDFALSNYSSVCDYLLNGKECQYLLEKVTSIYMLVATADLTSELVMRIDNMRSTLNAETYWMTWPETENYVYGKEIPCSAFQYTCEKDETFQDAKSELIDFANTGLSEALARQQALGVDTGCHESTSLKGLLSWHFDAPEGTYDYVEVPDGVNVLDTEVIPDNVYVKTLKLPSSLLFILPKTLSRIENIDLSETAVTKLHDIFTSFYSASYHRPSDCNLYLPKHCIEFSDIPSNGYSYKIHIPKSVQKIRGILACEELDFEKDSEVMYLGSDSICFNKYYYAAKCDVKTVNDYAPNLTEALKSVDFLYLTFKDLKYIEADTFNAPNKYRRVKIVGIDWKLDDLNLGIRNKLDSSNIYFALNKDSKAYEMLKDLKHVTMIDNVEEFVTGRNIIKFINN